MQIMIKYDPQELEKIQKSFPKLQYDKIDNSIKGKLEFNACYQKKYEKNRKLRKSRKPNWEIIPCSPGLNCLHGNYEIKILLSEIQAGWPKVFETSGKIKKIAQEINKAEIDLHLYPKDGRCCLGIYVNSDISLSDFIVNIVYPYFVWQAYFSKYKRIPPIGEYSHGRKGMQECLQAWQRLRRNNQYKCMCNSGKKYKDCCLRNEEVQNYLEEVQNYLKNMILSEQQSDSDIPTKKSRNKLFDSPGVLEDFILSRKQPPDQN